MALDIPLEGQTVIRYILLGLLVYFLFKWVRRGLLMHKVQRRQAGEKAPASELVRCARCSVYVSQDEAVRRNGEWVCSTDCLK
jgi:hypothetical protein